jgi:hypothetical protein
MKSLISILFAVICTVMFTACSTAAQASVPGFNGNNPYAVQPGDSGMMRGDVRIDSASVSVAQANPAQTILHFAYFQPTPCFSLRVEPGQPDAQNQIHVSAYAVAPKDKACTLMALATPLQAELNLGSYPKGHYSVWLNGAKVGEFDS